MTNTSVSTCNIQQDPIKISQWKERLILHIMNLCSRFHPQVSRPWEMLTMDIRKSSQPFNRECELQLLTVSTYPRRDSVPSHRLKSGFHSVFCQDTKESQAKSTSYSPVPGSFLGTCFLSVGFFIFLATRSKQLLSAINL